MNINFNNVEVAGEGNGLSKYTKPGYGVFTIVSTEFGTSSQKQTPFMEVTFKKDEDESTLKEKFYLSPGALPRIQYLLSEFTGNKLNSEVSSEQLNMLLVGRKAKMVVDGEESEKDGKIRTFATLRYAGFAEALTKPNALSAADVQIKKVQPAVNTATKSDDLPF